LKELLARRVSEEAHTELGCDEIQEAAVRKDKEVATDEHKTAEVKQEQAVKVEEKKAAEVEVAIDNTQKAHSAHKRAVTVHQEAVVVVETKEEARSQRQKEVADLEELLRLARLALGVAEHELDEAQIVEVQRAQEEKEAKEVLRKRKIEQTEAEDAHRIAHADMVEKTRIEKEKHQQRRYQEHKHARANEMVHEQMEVEKVAIKDMEDAIESAIKYARIAVDRRDDYSEAVTEAELAVEEKKIRAIEEIAAVDWWECESARMENKKEQIIAAEKQENLKKAELRADWEDRRSAFAKNRNRDESVIQHAQEEAASLSSVYQAARHKADSTQVVYEAASLKARESTDVAKFNRKKFDDEVLQKRGEYAIIRQTAGERGMKAYKEFLMEALKEITGEAKTTVELQAKVERALLMAMKGVDVYSSVPEKPMSTRKPAPKSKFDDDDYITNTPQSPPRQPKSPRFKKTLVVEEQPSQKEERAYENANSVHPWKRESPRESPRSPASRARAESTEGSPRGRGSSIDSRDYRDQRLNDMISSANKEFLFDNDVDQAEYETLQLAHKYKKAGNPDGDLLISSVRSKAAKDKFNEVHGTKY